MIIKNKIKSNKFIYKIIIKEWGLKEKNFEKHRYKDSLRTDL